MSRFLSELVTLDDGNGRTERLVGDLRYESDLCKGVIVVPAGFETDYASIPRGLWNVIPKNGKHDRAAVLHDWLYRSGRLGLKELSRKQADEVFDEALDVCGVTGWTRKTMYWGVRVGAGGTWERYRNAEVA